MRTKTCREASCGVEFVWLDSVKSPGKFVPVDVDTLSEEDVELLERGEPVAYDERRHVSHFRTCTEANTFSGSSRTGGRR
jgi:hypothetical protein